MDRSNLPEFYKYTITPDMAEVVENGVETITYLGFWQPGSLGADPLAQPRWQIRRSTHNSVYQTDRQEYAEGSELFNKIWNDRDNYNYSFLK